jgi:hypothetical protein
LRVARYELKEVNLFLIYSTGLQEGQTNILITLNDIDIINSQLATRNLQLVTRNSNHAFNPLTEISLPGRFLFPA